MFALSQPYVTTQRATHLCSERRSSLGEKCCDKYAEASVEMSSASATTYAAVVRKCLHTRPVEISSKSAKTDAAVVRYCIQRARRESGHALLTEQRATEDPVSRRSGLTGSANQHPFHQCSLRPWSFHERHWNNCPIGDVPRNTWPSTDYLNRTTGHLLELLEALPGPLLLLGDSLLRDFFMTLTCMLQARCRMNLCPLQPSRCSCARSSLPRCAATSETCS